MEISYFAGLILCNLVLSVLLAGLALAIGAAGFGNVDLVRKGPQVSNQSRLCPQSFEERMCPKFTPLDSLEI